MRKAKNVESVVYCGPSIPRVAHSFTTYAETPKALAALAEKCPAISALIVPVSEMAETRRALKTPGTKEAILFVHINKFIQGGI